MDTTIENRCGEVVSLQYGKIGVLDCSSGDFTLNDGGDGGFLIKNESDSPVTLRVRLVGMKDTDDLIETRFHPGWGMEIVRFVEHNPSVNPNTLKYGY